MNMDNNKKLEDCCKINLNKSYSEDEFYNSDSDNDSENSLCSYLRSDSEFCPICLLKFKKQAIGIPDACDHQFCLDCLLEWSSNVNTCPIDRRIFSIIYVKSLNGVIIEPIPISKNGASVILSPSQDRTFCEICSEDTREDQMLLCDACDLGYHLDCLVPPLHSVPPGEWFCPDCNQYMNSTLTSHSLNDCSEFNNNNGYHSNLEISCLRNSIHENKIIRRIRRKRKRKVSKKKAKKRISIKKSRRSRKNKSPKQRQKCIQRDLINRNSVRTKLACQLRISGVTKGYGLPIITPCVNASSDILKERSSISSLSLFGHSDELNIISEDDETETSSLSLYLESAQTSSDLLGDIMRSQELLYSSASNFVIEYNGALKHIKENQVNIHSVNQFKQCNSGEEKSDDNSKTITVKSCHVNVANVENKLNYESGNSETNNSGLNYYSNVNKNENDVLSVTNVYNDSKKEEEESDVDIYSDIDMQKHDEGVSLLFSKQLMAEEQLSDINELSDVSSTNDLIIDEGSPTNCASDLFETSSLQNEHHLDTSDLPTINKCQTKYNLESNDLEEGEIDEFMTEKSKNTYIICNENKDDSGSSIEDEGGGVILKLKERCIEIGTICNNANEEQVFWKRRKSRSHNRNYRDGRTNAIQELSKKEKDCHDLDFSFPSNNFGKSNDSCESSHQEQIMHRKKRHAISDFKESSEHQKKKKSLEQKSKEPAFENETFKDRQYNNKKSLLLKNIKLSDEMLELASTAEIKEQSVNITVDNIGNDISLNYKLSQTNKKGTEYYSERKEKNDKIHYSSKNENTKPKNSKLSPVSKETQNFIKAKNITDGKLKTINDKNKSKVMFIDKQLEEKFQKSNYTNKHHVDNSIQSVIKEVYQHGNKIIVNVNFETSKKINEKTMLDNKSHKHKKIKQKEKLINESQKISESSKQKLVNVKQNSNSAESIKTNMKSKKEKDLKNEIKTDDTKKKNSDYASKILQSDLHSSQKQPEQKFLSMIKSGQVECEISSNKNTHRRRKDSKKSKLSSRSRSSSQERKEVNYQLKSDLKFTNVSNQKIDHKIKNKKSVLSEHVITEVCKSQHSFKKKNHNMLSKKKSTMKTYSDSSDEKKLLMHKNSLKQKLKDKKDDKIVQLHSPRKKKKSEKYAETENLKQRAPFSNNCKHHLKLSYNSSFSESESEKASSLSSISLSPNSSQKYLSKPPVVVSSSTSVDKSSSEFKKCSANKHENDKKSDDKIEIIELSSFSDSDSDIMIINKNMIVNTEHFADNPNIIEVKADSITEPLNKNSEENNNSKEIESEPIIKFSICSRSNLKVISNPLASPESQTSANNLSTIKECGSTEPICKIFVNKNNCFDNLNLKESKTIEHNSEVVDEKNKFVNISALNIKEPAPEKFVAYDPFDPTDSPDGTPVSNNFDMFSFSNVESPISDSDKDKDCKFPIIQNNNSKITLYDSDCFSNNQVLSNNATNISKQSSTVNSYCISSDCQTIPLPLIPPPPTIDNVVPSQMFKPNLISCQTIPPCIVKQTYHRLSEASCIPYPNLNQPPPPLPVCNKSFTNMFSQPPPKLNVINETAVSKTRFHEVLFKPIREKMNTSDETYKDSDSPSSVKFQPLCEQKQSIVHITPVQCQSNKDQIVISSMPVVETTSDFKKNDVSHTPSLNCDKNLLPTMSDNKLEKFLETNEKSVNKKISFSSLSHKVDDKRNLEIPKESTYYNPDINYYSVNEHSTFKISSSSSHNQDIKNNTNKNFNLSYDNNKLRQDFQFSEETRNEIICNRDSPVSPDSNEGEDLFNPPSSEEENSFLKHQSPPSPNSNESSPVLTKNHKSKSSMKVPNNRLSIEDRFEALFGCSPSKDRKRTDSYEFKDKNDERVKSNVKRGKMKNLKMNVKGTKVQDMKLTSGKDFHLVDDIPSSAVELQVKEKYLKKLCLQETVVQEVKVILKPLYNKREIDKEMYKEILRKSVPKICHSKSNAINHSKLEHLIIGYVKKLKYEKSHKHRKLNSKHNR